MRRWIFLSIMFLSLLLTLLAVMPRNSAETADRPHGLAGIKQGAQYDLIIYGGGPQGVAAALQADQITQGGKRILMVVPESSLGAIWTVASQNLVDWNHYQSTNLPAGLPKGYKGAQAGSVYRFMQEMKEVFSPEKMALYLERLLKAHPNIEVLTETDISNVECGILDTDDRQQAKVTAVELQKIKKDEFDRYVFDPATATKVQAPIFIDASETGRLVRLTGHFPHTVGREDQNADRKQMAATLMFKLKGIKLDEVRAGGKAPFHYSWTDKGALQLWGGYELTHSALFKRYSGINKNFRIKPFNAGEDGNAGRAKQSENTEFWMNMLLVYDVDARKAWRDKIANNGFYPEDGGLDPEIAREMAIAEIKRPDFLLLLRTLPGFENAQLVQKDGQPVVGESLYLRESIHAIQSTEFERTFSSDGEKGLEQGTSPQKVRQHGFRFALDEAGAKSGGNDYYARRIGLGYYNFDSNTYENGEGLTNPWPEHPWYVPYETLVSPSLQNVLIPGYAANISSFAWTAMRVYPNLIMLGDAAGTAAGLALRGEFSLQQPAADAMQRLQNELHKQKVILDK